jgi:hypothetical protein
MEATGQTCPICEASILKVIQSGKLWWECDCLAIEDYGDVDIVAEGTGFARSVREIWAQEVLTFMKWYPDSFPEHKKLGSIPN